MKTKTLLVVSAAISTVMAYPVEDTVYSGYQHIADYPCGDNLPHWVVEADFGTPGQKSSLLLDTSTNATWTAGVMCHDEFCTSQKQPLYHAGKSSTSKKLHQEECLDYGNGKLVEVEYYQDEFQLGDVCIQNFTFGKAFSVQGFEPNPSFSGVLGLGGSISDLFERSRINKRGNRESGTALYPMHNDRIPKRSLIGRNNQETCELSYGINKYAFKGDLAWLDLPTCDYGASPFWKTKLTCVKIDGVVDLEFENALASFDTSVKYIEAPHDDVAKIHEKLCATYNENSGNYEFECCNAKDLTFSFEKYDVTIPASVWTIPTDSSGKTCTAKIAVSKSDVEPKNKWQLGTSFIKTFYTFFGYGRQQIGLGLLASGSAEGVKITPK